MNSKQRKVLEAIFAEPTSASIAWTQIENLLIAVGCQAVEGSGSRIKFVHRQGLATLHRPHPRKEAKRYQVREIRAFLEIIGVRP